MNWKTDAPSFAIFKAERLAMLQAADLDTTLAYLDRWDGPDKRAEHERNVREFGRAKAETVVLAGVHKARLSLTDDTISDQEKAESRAWLINHGFKPR